MSPASSPIVASSNHPLRSPRNDRSPRPGSGHHRLHGARPERQGPRAGPWVSRVHPAFPVARRSRARRRGDLARHARGRAGGIKQAGVTPDAIGITNQRETVCAWERATGRPLHRAIVWQDRRTAARCAQLARGRHAGLIRRRTGLVLDPYFSATKIEWLLKHVPGLKRRVMNGEALFGTVDAWLLFRLTGGATFATDHTNASRTMLYDITRHDWDPALLKLFGVPRHALPEIRASSGAFGVTTA